MCHGCWDESCLCIHDLEVMHFVLSLRKVKGSSSLFYLSGFIIHDCSLFA